MDKKEKVLMAREINGEWKEWKSSENEPLDIDAFNIGQIYIYEYKVVYREELGK